MSEKIIEFEKTEDWYIRQSENWSKRGDAIKSLLYINMPKSGSRKVTLRKAAAYYESGNFTPAAEILTDMYRSGDRSGEVYALLIKTLTAMSRYRSALYFLNDAAENGAFGFADKRKITNVSDFYRVIGEIKKRYPDFRSAGEVADLVYLLDHGVEFNDETLFGDMFLSEKEVACPETLFKATGFPIAKIAALLAVGYTLDELRNDITRTTPACFEPALDYVVTKVPRFTFEKFPGADSTLGTQMKSVGEAMAIGRSVVPMINLSGCKRLLDLAGGPAAYAELLVRANPGLSAVTVDVPAVAAVAAECVAEAGLQTRIECRPGDYHTDEYEAGAYDACTIFGALHQESPEQIRDILGRAQRALVPGGRLYVLDMMTDATHTAPAFSALFGLNMALTTQNGWVFSDAELKDWMREAGFTPGDTRAVPPPMPHWIVSAVRN